MRRDKRSRRLGSPQGNDSEGRVRPDAARALDVSRDEALQAAFSSRRTSVGRSSC